MQCDRASIVLFVCVVIGSTAGTAMAQSPIDGIWHGTYTSTYSPDPTPEVLIFQTVDDTVVGAYVSKSGATGTLRGVGSNNTYALAVTAPVSGCPEPATGVLHVAVEGDRITYSFQATSCKGKDAGRGEGVRRATGEATFSSQSASGS